MLKLKTIALELPIYNSPHRKAITFLAPNSATWCRKGVNSVRVGN